MEADQYRCGDHVLHGPSGETWVVAYHDPETGDLAPAGWPPGIARVADCTLVRRASDEDHRLWVSTYARSKNPYSLHEHVARLYGGTHG